MSLEKMLEFLLSSLTLELQPSCRHQLEWMYIYIVGTTPRVVDQWLIAVMDSRKVCNTLPYIIIANHNIPIAYHTNTVPYYHSKR